MTVMDEVLVIKEHIEAGNELANSVSLHPAIITSSIKKKGDPGSMDVDNGDLLEQIDMANKLVAEIDEKIKNLHKAIKNRYLVRYPELNISDPMRYIRTVQLLKNNPKKVTEDDGLKEQLNEILDAKMHLLVMMTAATTQGVKVEPDQMDQILRACAVAIHLADLRTKLLSFVEVNMATIAPSLSVIVGAPIAAKLMGFAGGILELAKTPACNVPILGSHRVSKIESDVNTPLRTGIIYECDLIQQIPFDHSKDIRKRAVRWVANKCVLAARCDSSQSDRNGNAGRMFRDQIESLIAKELEPPPKKAARPLPKPIDKSGKKRGGKRVRRMKDRYAQTELRKAANRMNFGEVGDDAYQNDLGFERSQLNAIQKLRGPQINDKTKVRLSKGAQKRLAKQNALAANDIDSKKQKVEPSIVVRPQEQGLEIFNPNAAESYTAGTSGTSSNYFSNSAGFSLVKKEVKEARN